jgi:DNA-binding PadR family transcriptional regulator
MTDSAALEPRGLGPVAGAVLGLLREYGPSYPYQLADRMQHRMGPAWDSLSGQVHQAVRTCSTHGLVRRVDHSGDVPERRKIYEITDAGGLAFDQFFEQDLRLRLPRRAIQVQLAFVNPDRLPSILARLDAYEQECTQRLGELMTAFREAQSRSGVQLRPDDLLLRLGAGADVAHVEAELDWAREAREALGWLSARSIWTATSSQGHSPAQASRQKPRLRLLEGAEGTADQPSD